MKRMKRVSLYALTLLLAAGCSSPIPELIRKPVTPEISVEQARRKPAELQGREVRWGGEIIEVENRRNDTLVETLAYPLSGSGRPDTDEPALGRFIARVAGFIDPAEYKAGRAFTVFGRLADTRTRSLGDYPYTYPVVDASTFYLWAEPPPERVDLYYPLYPWPPYGFGYYHWWYYPPRGPYRH